MYVIPEENLINICANIKNVLINEPNLLLLKAPINIVGDIHGQLHDLVTLIAKGGHPSTTQYLFLGDYVDRGYYSLETIQLLIIYKLRYPNNVHLLRGNHETREVSQIFGFKDEITRKYGNASRWHVFMEVFDLLPIAAVVSDKIFCVHAGLSKDVRMLWQINLIDRSKEDKEVKKTGKFLDLLWSDPDEDRLGFNRSSRGAGCLFGIDIVEEFCTRNNLDLIVRSHQLAEKGYRYPFEGKTQNKDAEGKLVIVWSVPNYCYTANNKATFLAINDKLERAFIQFEHNPLGSKIPITKMTPYFL